MQPRPSGKIGMNGISYYAINQWTVASRQPPHLAAIRSLVTTALSHDGAIEFEAMGEG